MKKMIHLYNLKPKSMDIHRSHCYQLHSVVLLTVGQTREASRQVYINLISSDGSILCENWVYVYVCASLSSAYVHIHPYSEYEPAFSIQYI